MDEFLRVHERHIVGVVNGFDRLVLRGRVRRLSFVEGMMAYLWSCQVLLKDFGQGCSTLFEVFHREQGFEAAEGGGVAILGDGVGLIEAQDIVIVGEYSGEDARGAADARFIFAEGDVARVVLLVFDAPVVANGGGGLFGMDRAIGQVERALE